MVQALNDPWIIRRTWFIRLQTSIIRRILTHLSHENEGESSIIRRAASIIRRLSGVDPLNDLFSEALGRPGPPGSLYRFWGMGGV